MKWISLLPMLFFASYSSAAHVDLHITVQMKACYADSSCAVHSTGGSWVEVGLKEIPNEFDIPYFIGEAEVKNTFSDHTFVSEVFLEHWPRTQQYKLTTRLYNAKVPEQKTEIVMWIGDIRDFTRFELSGFSVQDGDRKVMPHLELGPRYRTLK